MARNSQPYSIADVLKSTFQKLHIDQPIKKYSVWNYWEDIVGRNIASKAQPTRVQDKTLIVGVISHTWMTELTLMKTFILKKMQDKIENCPIQNIRFELDKSMSLSTQKKKK